MRLLFQSVLFAPYGQLPLIIRAIGALGATQEIFLGPRFALRVILDLVADLVGAFPFPSISHQAHEAAPVRWSDRRARRARGA